MPGQRLRLPVIVIKPYWLGFHTTKKFQNVGLLEKPLPVGLFSYGAAMMAS